MSRASRTDREFSVLMPVPAGDSCGLPFGAAVIRAGETASGSVLVLLPGQAGVDQTAFGPALSAFTSDSRIGAVVPRVLWPDGSLAEAGAMAVRDGTIVSCGQGESPDRSEHRFRRAVDGTRFGCAAVRRSLIAGLSLDPDVDEPTAVVSAVLGELRRLGHTVLLEPDWSVTAAAVPPERSGSTHAALTGHQWASLRDSGMAQRILVVTGTLAGLLSPWADAGIVELIGALRADCPGARLTVACAEGSGSHRVAAGLRASGIEVEVGPADWSRWFEDRAYHFSHLVVTDAGVLSGLARRAMGSQPQAAKILWTTTLPFRAVEGMLAVTPYAERAGHEHVLDEVAERTSELVRQFDSVWCGSTDDQQYLSGLLAGIPVRRLNRPVPPPSTAGRGYGDRSGLAVIAGPGGDIVSAHEDAAMSAAGDIFARLHRRHPELRLAVITDRPSPMVDRLADRPGVELAAPGADGGLSRLSRARVVLAPYHHGLGGPAVLFAAMSAGTPVLTTSCGARGFVLADLAEHALVDDPLEMVERASVLHQDRDAWNQHRAAMDDVAETFHGRRRFLSTVSTTMLDLGVATPARRRPDPRLDQIALGDHRETAAARPAVDRLSRPALRPGDAPNRVPLRVPDGVPETDGYRLWRESRGPTPLVVESLQAEIGTLGYQPKISVITPVYNTDPEILDATIASVRDQIYGNWELCLADDGSTRAETQAVLQQASGDPRVHVIHLPGQSGISAASNAGISLASGEYITLLDHDDLLKPHALAQVVRWLNHDPTLDILYSDEDKLDGSGRLVDPYLKPDWSPDLLMSRNYINHLLVVRKLLVDKLGGFRSDFDGSQDYDLLLRLSEETGRIGHIPEPLYTWRMDAGSTAADVNAKPYAFDAAKRALAGALGRRGVDGTVEDGLLASTYRTRYRIPGSPRVAIIIPTRDRVELLRRCVDSIVSRTGYRNYEIVVIDNESSDPRTLEYLSTFPGRVVRYPAAFNYARMLNLAAHSISCDALLFLNNDTEVINSDWIESLLEHAMRPEVGAVGCRLYYPDGRLQHEGILVGILGVAANVDHGGFWALGDLVRNCSAVTGACVMMRPAVYWAVGGNDERLRVAYNDVDICLRIRQAGYQIVYTPYARLNHFEGASRAGFEHSDDRTWFSTRWRQFEEWDPYYNPNYDRMRLFRMAL